MLKKVVIRGLLLMIFIGCMVILININDPFNQICVPASNLAPIIEGGL